MNVRHLLVLLALQTVPSHGFAAEWQVDPSKSAIRFSGVQVGVPFTGGFQRFEAAVDFDPAKPETGHATVLIDLSSAKTGDVQRDEALPKRTGSTSRRRRRPASRRPASSTRATAATTRSAH
ncbi:YceI family protein [Methylobacterium sp. WL19]|uniref:YceI family protein n=1 Tax=Methylobacterium sp. WL19 TaxID=2603896 RepID=UPI001FEE6379|nr:YceI family protein [Methylobacterium sp. WL19]